MIGALVSIYLPSYLRTLVYMLQSAEYEPLPYLKWYWRTQNFSQVMKRRQLESTKAARLLLLTLQVGIGVELIAGLVLLYLGATGHVGGGIAFGIALLVGYPVIWAHLIVVPLIVGREFVTKPAKARAIERAKVIFAKHPGVKIAVAGSYGKTTMKELLLTVLSQGLDVAATPANKNVSASHAAFARKLTGKEDALVIEYGEGFPGDTVRFATVTKPTHAVITGLAPAHLDHYKSMQDVGEDFFSLANFVPHKNLYVNADSHELEPFMQPSYQTFSTAGALGWKVTALKTDVTGISFTLTKGKHKLALSSGLVGRHQAGFLAFAAALALELGLTEKQVKAGIKATVPYEHRMQPYELNGAWIIDDTYNGNLEGIRVGTQVLHDLSARRKIYVSPGLVDQGKESPRVHNEMGELIAKAKPDIVVLMQNSVTSYIQAGLENAKYAGEVRVETDPLEFYTNLKHFIAADDLIVMQNDWTDNYA
jgi:UDP-N-acetylmuramoyl-tripeptide--D-alanyl-D-alanine ligase